MTAAEYLEELKIKPVKRLSQLEDNLIITLGKKKATEIIDTINARGRAERQGRKPDDKKFYSIKHRDFRTSMLISGAFDGDIILRISEWLEDSTVTFGEKVLDIGCENGIITCPWHGFQYDLATGECLTAPEVQLQSHGVKVVGNRVEVRLAT